MNFVKPERNAHSYIKIPDSYYSYCKKSHLTPLTKEVLNFQWASIPRGSEDSAQKNFKRFESREALYKCENEKYIIDQ